jgi:toxin ParE1/3/4
MPKITFSKEARKDLISIRRYIHDELCNPNAARRIIASLKESILSLEDFSNRGRPLDALIPVHTEYRYLVCDNYCVFYLASPKEVIIIRILHRRQDCLKALFAEG